MKIFSTEYSKHREKMHAKSVVVEKKGSKLTLLKHYNTDAENIQHLSKNMPLYAGIDYYDYIDETLNLPPIKEYKTFRTLALNKLKDSLAVDTDYMLIYKQNIYSQPDSAGNIPYRVFLAPESVFYEMQALSEEQKQNISLFTLTDFALCALTVKYFPNETVFHAYASGDKICVTISQGDVILYTRSNIIGNDIKDRMNSYYEYLNLTYMFVTKNMHLKLDHVILSGSLTDMPELSAMFFEFSQTPQATLTPWAVIQNCNYELFQEYIVPISLCLLDKSYNFTPREIVREQTKRSLLFYGNTAACVILLLMFFMTVTSAFRLKTAENDVEFQSSVIKNRRGQYSETVSRVNDKKYDLSYYKLLQSGESDSIRNYPDFADLLNAADFETVTFNQNPDGVTEIAVTGKLTFGSLEEAEKMKNTITGFLAREAVTSKYTVSDSGSFNMPSMSALINLRFKQNSGGNGQ
ncbi:MAG: hypothetical protein AB7E96_06615 [Deferribacterales bacterium]